MSNYRRSIAGFILSTQRAFQKNTRIPTYYSNVISNKFQLAARSSDIQRTRSFIYPLTGSVSNFHSNAILLQRPTDSVPGDEAKKLLNLVKVDEWKKHLLTSERDYMPYSDAIKLCKEMGFAENEADAQTITKRLDDAGVILIFRNKVFLRPEKVSQLVGSVLPACPVEENDPRRQELMELEKQKQDIDKLAHKQVRRIIWGGFWGLTLQSALFFRLTFWDLSWDVMEPITFFVTSGSIMAGLLFFIFTRREPSYNDILHIMFTKKQMKLMKKRKFNLERYTQLQTQLHMPGCDANSSLP